MSSFYPDQLIKIEQVCSLVTLSKSEIWRRVRDKTFPAPLKISPGRRAWRYREIADWVSDIEEFGQWMPDDHDDLPDHPDESF